MIPDTTGKAQTAAAGIDAAWGPPWPGAATLVRVALRLAVGNSRFERASL